MIGNSQSIRIAVIIPVYNRARYVIDALNSIDQQSRLPDEIVIVDDGSTDNSVELIQSWQPNRAPKPIVLRQENGGAATARNTAIKHTNAELIAPLDSDDVFLPGHLELLEKAFVNQPTLVACSGNSGRLDDAEHFKKMGFNESVFHDVDWEPRGDLRLVLQPFRLMLRGAFIPTCSCMFSRQSAMDCGLFDESLRTCEDTDFWLRMSKEGPFGFFMEKISLVRKHDDNLTHRRNIVLQIMSQIYGYEKLIQMSGALELTGDELAATKALLKRRIAGAVNRASRYGLKPYLAVCRELAKRGYWLGLVRVKPMIRAAVFPRGNSSKLKPIETPSDPSAVIN